MPQSMHLLVASSLAAIWIKALWSHVSDSISKVAELPRSWGSSRALSIRVATWSTRSRKHRKTSWLLRVDWRNEFANLVSPTSWILHQSSSNACQQKVTASNLTSPQTLTRHTIIVHITVAWQATHLISCIATVVWWGLRVSTRPISMRLIMPHP